MSNSYFKFKQFTIHQDRSAMKVTTDACLFGAWAADDMKQEQPACILDIGTGTGLLSLMVAQSCTNSRIDAVEIETGAAAQAAENCSASPWRDRVSVMHSDILESSFPYLFDVIICNPPFYENELASPDAKKNMAHHAGGLLLQELLLVIKQQLAPHGRAYLLLPAKRKEEIPGLLKNAGLKSKKLVWVKQSMKHEPFRVMILCGHDEGRAATAPEDILIIEEAPGKYTGAFARLLKDYYLYL